MYYYYYYIDVPTYQNNATAGSMLWHDFTNSVLRETMEVNFSTFPMTETDLTTKCQDDNSIIK